MGSHADANDYVSALSAPIRSLTAAAHEVFVSQGCTSYVKTIYIGYDFGGEMVAALYAHAEHIEVALALPEDAEGELLIDASHLTWRTLPVAAILNSDDDISEFTELVSEAAARVKAQTHDVKRDNDFFIKSRRERRLRGG